MIRTISSPSRLNTFTTVLRPSKHCILRRKVEASTESRTVSIAETALSGTLAMKSQTEEAPMFSGFCPPDEDHPHYAIWERGMLETIERYAAQQAKLKKISIKQLAQKKPSTETDFKKTDPLYLDWNRRIREVEESLFKKCNIKREVK